MDCIVNVRDPLGPKIIICAHLIETRVARSRGDFARFFQKSGKSTPSPLRPNLRVGGSTLLGRWRKDLVKA